MPRYVIADASVLIILDKINQLDLLNGVYNQIYTTPEIFKEYGKPLPDWIIIKPTKDKKYQKFIETQVDDIARIVHENIRIVFWNITQ